VATQPVVRQNARGRQRVARTTCLVGDTHRIGVVAWHVRRMFPLIALGFAIVLAGLLPVLGFVPFKGQNFSTVADRYMYVPLAGVALIVSSLVMRTTMNRRWWLLAVSVLCSLAVLNVRYQTVWHDDLTLWRHAALTYPGQARVHNNYGAVLQSAGSQEEAIGQFDLALKARPDFSDAYCNRGNSLGQMRRYPEALADQSRAIELDPSDGGCWYDRAVTFFAMGRFQESFSDATQAQQRGYQPPPGFVDAVRARLNATGR